MRYEPFTSFDEIDQQLKVLKLKNEIELERIKLNAHRFKSNLSPSHFLERLRSKILLSGLTGKLLQKLRS